MGMFMKVVDGQYNIQRCYHGNHHQETFSDFTQLLRHVSVKMSFPLKMFGDVCAKRTHCARVARTN
jgi:hypothetical protein